MYQLLLNISSVMNDAGQWIAIIGLGSLCFALRAEVRRLQRVMGVQDAASVARVRENVMQAVNQ